MGIQILNGVSLSSVLVPISMADVQAIREPAAMQAAGEIQTAAPQPAAAPAPSSPTSLMSSDTLAQVIQMAQSESASSTDTAAASQSAAWTTFPPANAPQAVQTAWSDATAGLSDEQKTSLTALASVSEQHWTLQGGELTAGAAGEPADFDYAGFAQGMIEGLKNSEQYDTTPTEQAGVDTFQKFAANLASGSA